MQVKYILKKFCFYFYVATRQPVDYFNMLDEVTVLQEIENEAKECVWGV